MEQDRQLVTRIIREEGGWDAIRRDWDELFEASPQASSPLDFSWLRKWWEVYGSVYGGGMRIITAWQGQRLIGALPLYIGRRAWGLDPDVLRFISTGEAEVEETCADYLNLLCLPGWESECLQAIWEVVNHLPWDQLELNDLPADSPLTQWSKYPLDKGLASLVPRGVCPIGDLSHGFDAYIENLSPKTRQHARQYLRSAEKSGAMLELATPLDVDIVFNDLVRLHQERWTAEGKAGCFAAPRFTEFHRALAHEWIPKGRAVLARLSHGGQVHAVIYGFVTHSKFDFYQSGVRRADNGPFISPGTTANLMLMKTLSLQGVVAYDFLRGSSAYKQRLASGERQLLSLRMERFSLRSAIQRVGGFPGRVFRKARRLLDIGKS